MQACQQKAENVEVMLQDIFNNILYFPKRYISHFAQGFLSVFNIVIS